MDYTSCTQPVNSEPEAPAQPVIDRLAPMTRTEAAKYLGIVVGTLNRLKPPKHMCGMHPRYFRDELDAWIRGAK